MLSRHALALVLLAVPLVLSAPLEYHDTLDDEHDFAAVMADRQLLRRHVDCYVDRGPCTDVMQSYKKHIPTFMRESCARCNPPQKHMLRVWFDGLEKVDPEGYELYRMKYDPDNVYIKKLRAAVADF